MPQTASATAAGQSVTPLSISMQSPPDDVIGQPYDYQLSPIVSGGTPPYGTVAFAASNLPPGLSLSLTGRISGTPGGSPQAWSVSATVTDSGN